MRGVALLVLVGIVAVGCGSALPARGVIERDVGPYAYRRYQRVLDVEFPIQGNDAVGHTATYVRRSGGRTVSGYTAFVTVYQQPRALVAEVRDRLDTLAGYEIRVGDVGGGYAWMLDGGEDDRWAIWVSENRVVKLGSTEGGAAVPEEIADAYMSLYPSDLDESGRAREGSLSAGQSNRDRAEEAEEQDLPQHLRENTPR
jgi:hypothetical protein